MLFKAFRLFVSSTFTDFAHERELLQAKVFPALDVYCAARGYQFHAVDLRWGVNEEAQLDQRTAEICLGEVTAAKLYPPPNFLIMVGDRYGWVPLPFAIARDEFEALTVCLTDRGRTEAVRGLRKVYALDENHPVPHGLKAAADSDELIGAYTLRSREDDIPELAAVDVWQKLEDELRGALQEAASHLAQTGRISESEGAKYFLSLTEQEIIQGLPGYNGAAGSGAVSPLAQPGTHCPQSIAWIRERVDGPRRPSLLGRMLAKAPSLPAEREPRVEMLKSEIRRALPRDCVLSGRATRNGRGQLDETYLAGFASAIESRIKAAIDRQIAIIDAEERSAHIELLRERAQHRAFGEDRRSVFFGRDGNRSAIASYIASDNPHPLILFGRSGLGKSSLMAQATADAEEAGQGVAVIYRFVGASAASSDLPSLLVSIVEDLAARGVTNKPDQWEDDANKFDAQIRGSLLSIDRPAVIFLDALDQLKKPYRLGWLPDKLPSSLKIIVSVLNDADYEADSGIYKTLRQRLPSQAFLEIEGLTRAQGRDVLMALEARTQRRLQPAQRDYILGQFEKAGASPLYLRMAFEIARLWRSWDKVDQGRCVLADDTTALISQFIAGLSDVHHHEPELVSRTLGYLAAAKEGLSVKELTEVLSGDKDVITAISSERHGVRTHKLPDSVWVRLHRHLAPLLVEKRIDEQPLLQFFHRQLAEVAHQRDYAPARAALHDALATYFDLRAGETDKHADTRGTKTYARRSLSELPYQLFHSERRTRLDQILMAPDWMQQKLSTLGPQALVADYDQFAAGYMQTLVGRTLRLITGICTRDPSQLLPQLFGRLMGCKDLAAPAFLSRVRGLIAKEALLPTIPSLRLPGAEVARLEGHTGWIQALAMLPDGRLASGSADKTIRLWDTQSCTETARLEGHTERVTALAVLPDGWLASGSDDMTIRLWNPDSAAADSLLYGHVHRVTALAVFPDGRLASGSDDHTVRLWDPSTGAEIATIQGHIGGITALAILPEGWLASASLDNTIRLWDPWTGGERASINAFGTRVLAALSDGRLASASNLRKVCLWDPVTGTETGSFEDHPDGSGALAVLPDGRLVLGSDDKLVRILNPTTGAVEVSLEGHSGGIVALAWLPDGRIASASFDETVVRLWDASLSGEDIRPRTHADEIGTLAVLPDGRLASASRDRTVRLWDFATGSEIARLEGAGMVSGLAVLPDGRLAWGDGSTVRLWDPSGDAQDVHLKGHSEMVRALAVLPEGRLASASDDMTIRLWVAATGLEAGRLEGHRSSVFALAKLPGNRFASASHDRTVRFWNATTRLEEACLDSHGGAVFALAMLLGDRLASGSDDMTVRIWNTTTGVEAERLEGHDGAVFALAVLPGGCLASGSDDRTVRIWDLTRAAEVCRFEFDSPIFSLVVLPDGRLVAGDTSGRLHWLNVILPHKSEVKSAAIAKV